MRNPAKAGFLLLHVVHLTVQLVRNFAGRVFYLIGCFGCQAAGGTLAGKHHDRNGTGSCADAKGNSQTFHFHNNHSFRQYYALAEIFHIWKGLCLFKWKFL
jgi:hypothetical protein